MSWLDDIFGAEPPELLASKARAARKSEKAASDAVKPRNPPLVARPEPPTPAAAHYLDARPPPAPSALEASSRSRAAGRPPATRPSVSGSRDLHRPRDRGTGDPTLDGDDELLKRARCVCVSAAARVGVACGVELEGRRTSIHSLALAAALGSWRG